MSLPSGPRPASRARSLTARGALALASAALALVAAAGGLALATGRPLLPTLSALIAGRGHRDGGTRDDGTGEAAGGMYRVHPDPLVGYVLKRRTTIRVLEGLVHGDKLGLRSRPGPPRGEDPLRIVVAGDSVAFGYGLDDDKTIAAQLEVELNAVLGRGARPVECRTVALPGWNHRNTVACLLVHWGEFDPDIVVYMPVSNDLFDTDAIDETGSRRPACDFSAADPWLIVNQTSASHVQLEAARRQRDAGREDLWETLGPQAIAADISAESIRRFDENAASLARLRQRLLERGAHFLVATYQDEGYVHHLLRRFDEQGVSIDVVRLFRSVPHELMLPDDPHPDAEAASAMARWIAADLLARGWVAGADRPVPPPPAWIEELRAPALTPRQRRSFSTNARRLAWQQLQRLIDLPSGHGCNQILGGMDVDGIAGPHALFLLPRPARSLTVQLEPLPDREDLLPLDVQVQIDGLDIGTLRLAAGGPTTGRFDVPPFAGAKSSLLADAVPLEVRLVADRWCVSSSRGYSVLAAFRVVRLETHED